MGTDKLTVIDRLNNLKSASPFNGTFNKQNLTLDDIYAGIKSTPDYRTNVNNLHAKYPSISLVDIEYLYLCEFYHSAMIGIRFDARLNYRNLFLDIYAEKCNMWHDIALKNVAHKCESDMKKQKIRSIMPVAATFLAAVSLFPLYTAFAKPDANKAQNAVPVVEIEMVRDYRKAAMPASEPACFDDVDEYTVREGDNAYGIISEIYGQNAANELYDDSEFLRSIGVENPEQMHPGDSLVFTVLDCDGKRRLLY